MKTAIVESPPEEQQAIVLRQESTLAHHGNPLDMEPETFSAGLARRKANRKSLVEWVRENLVQGVDFDRIHIVGKGRCPHGNQCTNLAHFSKPCLFKPGAEKICGMMGVTVTFPTLCDYEAACVAGTKLTHILLRCEIRNAAGATVAEGVGARNLEQDYQDLNKSLKMAEKSAMIDATLRMGGLSEVFSQDVDDEFAGKEYHKPEASAEDSGYLPSDPGPQKNLGASTGKAIFPQGIEKPEKAGTTATQPARTANINPPPTQQQKDRMLSELVAKYGDQKALHDYAVKAAILLPTETLLDWPLRFVPNTQAQMKLLGAAIDDFFEGRDAARPFVNSEPASKPQTPKSKVEVPRDANCDANSDSAPWRTYTLPFGKEKGTQLGKVDKKYLYGFWAGFKCEPTFEGKDGKPVRKSAASMAKDKEFRKMLDEAGKHYGFTENS